MALDGEALVVAIFFLLPGFLANSLANMYSTSSQRQPSAYHATMSSLAISVGIFIGQITLASVALGLLWLLARDAFDWFQFDILVDSGLREYFREQPLLTFSTLFGSALLAVVFAALIGFFDFGRKLTMWRLSTRGLTPDDYWYTALERSRVASGKDFAYAEVVLTSKDVISGTVIGFSFGDTDTGSRDLLLADPEYAPSTTPPTADIGSEAAEIAILNSKDIESIRVFFVDEEPE